ncbi:DNA polymerase [Symmachiella dynata]|uniref:DNA polymerase n=1 Tax=Symmachiella dynata TaxID=2527995 RepID=UPI0030EBDC75
MLSGWKEKIEQAPPSPSRRPVRIPLSAAKLSRQVQVVKTSEEAEQMVQLVYEAPVSYIGIDTEYRFAADAPIALNSKKEWRDIRSIQSFCLAFAVVGDRTIVNFAIDLRLTSLLPFIQRVLDLPVPFVCHHAQSELFVLWQLGLREPRIVWDTLLAERALRLGKKTFRARTSGISEYEEIRTQAAAEEAYTKGLGLDAVADRYGIPISRSATKLQLQESFLTKPVDEPLTKEELRYCAEDAEITAQIREPQRMACDRSGICEILDRVMMPWNVTTAETQWIGVKFDRSKCQLFRDASEGLQAKLAGELTQYGIDNPGSSQQIAVFLKRNGLAGHFPKTTSGQVSTSDRLLETREHIHPAIPLIRRFRKIRILAKDPAVTGLIEGVDGRVHTDFAVLGAESGRTQSRTPNLMGIGRHFRPLVCASNGYGIGDVDLSQIEIGIAAAVFGDRQMIEDFNSGDVYVAQAKRIFTDLIPPEDRSLPDAEFKRKHKNLRNRCKPLALGIIYGKSVYGLSADLGIPIREAKQLWDTFRNHYQDLCDGMEDAREQSVRRGYAYLSGLRRFRRSCGVATAHEKRGLGNSYVQGTAALVFFDAGNRLRRLYRRFGARLIIPVHDAYVFEAPLGCLREIAELTSRVMTETVQEWFPDLHPRAEINIEHPKFWNYEGNADSVDRFIADPTLQL